MVIQTIDSFYAIVSLLECVVIKNTKISITVDFVSRSLIERCPFIFLCFRILRNFTVPVKRRNIYVLKFYDKKVKYQGSSFNRPVD